MCAPAFTWANPHTHIIRWWGFHLLEPFMQQPQRDGSGVPQHVWPANQLLSERGADRMCIRSHKIILLFL